MAVGVTGFPSRGGHFGIRRLNVSFGLGPRGFTAEAAQGTPTTDGGVVFIPGSKGNAEAPTVLLASTGFVLVAEVAAPKVESRSSQPDGSGASSPGCSGSSPDPKPKARSTVLGPTTKRKK